MAFEFKFPDVGEGIHEGEIVKWRVKVGDEVKEDQVLVEMETAKAIVELPSPKAGTVLVVNGKEGEVVHVGDILVVIGAKDEKFDVSSLQKKSGPGVIGEIPMEEKGVVLPPRNAAKNVTMSTQNVTLSLSKGDDSRLRQAQPDKSQAQHDAGPVERIPLKSVRKAIAEHMVKSASTIPHVTHVDEADMTAVIAAREKMKPAAEKQGIKLTFLAFIVKAVTETLKKHPMLNSFFNDANKNEIIVMKYFNIGIAVDTPEGLMVPVIKNADQKDVLQIAKEIADLAQKCRDRKIDMADLQGGSFSITNVGSVGGMYATPIITYGQCANIAVMRMKEKPVAREGKIEIRPMQPLCLAFDHRVVDGADAARFMNDLVITLEKP